MRSIRFARAAVGIAGLTGLCACQQQPREIRATMTVAEALGRDDTAGYARVRAPRAFVFPADHGPHPEYRVEWWYFTGNLRAEDGRAFGYQLTFFRSALAPAMPPRTSSWAARQAFMAHFALSDSAAGRFHAFERFSRAAAGLAGAAPAPFRVWLDDWSAHSSDTTAAPTPSGIFPLRLRAHEQDIAIDLELLPGKPLIAQGQSGFSAKSAEPGNASHYYSFMRMTTRGTVRAAGRTFNVTGDSWLDREWGTSALAAHLAGWDWFALRLSNGADLMLYQLRTHDGRADPFSAGTLVPAAGPAEHLSAAEFRIDVLETWKSLLDTTRYPARWRVRVPAANIDLDIVPLLADQELNLSVRYWEGAVNVRGSAGTGRVTGNGYVELTGYATSAGPRGS
jgi:predicted secreted hydrolase